METLAERQALGGEPKLWQNTVVSDIAQPVGILQR
jgi:hypothetical protein